MSLNTKRLLLILINCFTYALLSAQTLYWVGGSGNFNDPKHWSLTSGGASVNQIPNSGTDVVFDDNSSNKNFIVNFVGENYLKNLNQNFVNKYMKTTGLSTSIIHSTGQFNITSDHIKYFANSQIIFESNASNPITIDFGPLKLTNNIAFGSGNYNIVALQVGDANTIRFGNGKYTFNSSIVAGGNIINENGTAQFDINNSYFFANSKFKISGSAIVKSENTFVTADLTSPGSYNVPLSLSSSKGYTNVNTTNAVCPVTISLTPACSGTCTGVLTVSLSPTCTNTPYSVQVSNGSCPAFATALSNTNIPSVYTVTNACACAANYIIVVRDGSNALQAATNTANFTPNSAIIFDNNIPPQCSYSCDGSLQGTIIGTAPFIVSVIGTGTTIPSFTTATGDYTITNMCPGTYTFNITDAGGCFTPLTNILGAPAPLLTNAVTTSISCNNICTGAYAISPSGGTSNYTVNFSSSPTQTVGPGGTVTTINLCTGPVSATVTDFHGCTVTASSNINQPPPMVVANTQTNLTCNAQCIGAASSTVSGATPPFTYSWSPSVGSSSLITGLCAGTQTLRVTDANGCVNTSQTFTITEPTSVTLTPTFTNITCAGTCTGSAAVSAAGGTGAFSYTWVAPGPFTISTGAVNTQTGLCAGAYTVVVKDANNCTSQVVISISQPPLITLTAVSQSVSCFGANNGSATVTINGGNGAPFTFNWSPGGMSTSVITGLGPNVYSVTVLDAAACPSFTTVTIIEPAGLTPAVTFTNLSCNVLNAPCNGKINATPVGGTLPYSYSLVTVSSTITTAPPYNNLCVDTYTVMVKDISGCPQQSVVTLTQPAALIPSTSITSPIPCFGGTIGGLTGSPGSGGTPGYTLTWATPTGTAAGAILSNQSAGNFTLFVVDGQSCTAQSTTVLTQPSSVTVALGTSSITCFSTCNGVLTSTVSGGTPAYTYAWTNSLSVNVGNAPTAVALCPGPYTLTINDANSCVKTATGSVLSPPPIVLTETATPVACFGDSNGSATVTASGGTPPFNFQFNSTPIVNNTTGILSGQPSGTYIATVTDFVGCAKTISMVITSPGPLTANITGTIGSCNVCNGGGTVSPVAGNLPYNIAWTNSLSASMGTNAVVGNLCPGNYTVTVTDAKACVATNTISVTQVINISINLGGASIICNGALTGSATANPGGGTPGYTYSWTPSGQTNSVLTGVASGNYTVRVTDSSTPSACSHTAAIFISQPPAITVTATQTNVTCFGFTNGAASTTVTGGTGAITYSWSPGSQTTSAISSLSAGTYTMFARDGNLCPASQAFSITQSPSITITYTASNPTGCAAPNGSICVTASGGSGAGYTYTWSPVTGTNSCISGLNGGTYQHTVTDGAGCTNSVSITLFNAIGPTLTAVSHSVTCFGASTGSAMVTAAGAGGFTFTWSPSVPSNLILSGTTATALPSNNYVVTCSDLFGCVTSTNIPIAQAPSVTINSTAKNVNCFAACNGSITVAPTGGTPGVPSYTFAWLPVAPVITGQGTGTVTNLCANPYTLNLRDGNNCLTSYTFGITQPSSITVSAVTTSLLCNNIPTGSIVANASGGTGALNYSWTPVGGNSPTLTGLAANTGTNPPSYTLTVTDATLCSLTTTYIITQPSAITSTVNVVSASCSNSCNAVATHTVVGGTPGYNYSWSTGTLTANTLSALCAGNYTATVTDANGCVFVNQFTVTPPAALSVTLSPTNPLCNAACNGSISTNITGAQGTVTYSWFPSGAGQSPSGLCATPVNAYTLVATDQNSCSVTAITTLTNPPALLAAVSATNPLCNGNSNGFAVVNFTNAIGATSYTWLPTGPPTQTTQTATNLSPGNYTVIVKDNNQCQTSQTFTLVDPPSFTVNTSISPATCSGSNGAITANPTGGTPGAPVAYTYSWTGVVSSSSVVSSLFAGIYTLQVTDGVGCSTTVVIPLSNANGPSIAPILTTSLTCNSQCIGTASVDTGGIIGGTGPYTASWIAPAPSTVNPLSNLCAGTYTAQILDAIGCILFASTTIAEPLPIILAPSIGLPLCPGICNGTVALNTSGGNAPYSYTWSPGGASTSTLNGLCAGDYTVIVGYNTVCSTTSVINIPDQSTLTVVTSVTNNACFGDCNAVASLSVTGGSAPYGASWNNSQTGLLVTGLCNGNYSAVITDNNGCMSNITTSITSAPQITATTSVGSPSCGLCNGTATVATQGGSAPFNFNWSTSATTQAVSNLCAGVYQVVISDALACTQTQTVIVNNSNGITGETFSLQEIPCSGLCNGAATVIAIGGTQPITYNWLNPVTAGTVISNICPGTYFVQMTDANGCIRTSSVSLNPLVTMSVSPFVKTPACGVSNGSINLVISGGTPTYAIVWNPPAGNTTSITALNTGIYSFTVTESSTHSCSLTQTITMGNTNGPIVAATQQNINCFNQCTGALTIAATSTATPLQYAWSNGQSVPTITALCKGVLTLTVTDSQTPNACKTLKSYTITDNPEMIISGTNIHQPVCMGDCDGRIRLLTIGGVIPYTYSWTPGTQTVNPLSSLCDGTYSSVIRDAKGCTITSPKYTITSASSMSLSSNTFSSSCSSVPDGSISLTPSGGVASYSFTWQGPKGFIASTQNLNNIFSGSYSVVVTDNLGCIKTNTLQVVPTITIVAKAGFDATICPTTGTVLLDGINSSGSASFNWYKLGDPTNTIAATNSIVISNLLEPQLYVLVATASITTCIDRDTVKVDLYNLPNVDAGNDFVVPVYSQVILGGNPTSSGLVTYSWAPSNYLSDPSIANPVATNTVNMVFTVTITDDKGCISSDSILVSLYPELNVSSGFSPNNDGKNDLWIIDYIDQFPDNTVQIFNRWGDELFSSKGYQTPFDGKYKGKDLPVGTYYYVINLNHPGYPKPITGPLTIFR